MSEIEKSPLPSGLEELEKKIEDSKKYELNQEICIAYLIYNMVENKQIALKLNLKEYGLIFKVEIKNQKEPWFKRIFNRKKNA